MSIGQTLIDRGLLSPEQLHKASELQKREGLRLDRAVVQLGFLPERTMLEILAEQLHLTIVDLEEIAIDNHTLKSIPPRFVYRKRLVPFVFQGALSKEDPPLGFTECTVCAKLGALGAQLMKRIREIAVGCSGSILLAFLQYVFDLP